MSETKYEYDLFVIGTGPGGEGAAMQARKGGLRVAVAEDHPQIGGNCTHHGTIPSKALRHTISATVRAMRNPTIQAMGVQLSPTMDQLRRGSQTIVSRQVTMRQSFYDRNSVPIYRGTAYFVDEHTVQVGVRRVTAKNFVLAPGTRPFRPTEVNFNHPCVFDSDTILDIKNRPTSVTVYGAGVIGCEYASMFRDLGSKVNLVNTRAKLLEFLDDEIIDALSYHLRDRGVIIRHNEEMESVELLDDGAILTLKSGKRLKSDAFLWANGRSGNVEKLALDKVGLIPDSRGQLSVNEHFQTSSPHIYAVGDVIGYPSLASAAYTQGRAAAMYMLGESDEDIRSHDIPTGIYTSPEISSVGKTERELTAARVPYEVGQAQFRSLARAQITGDTVGMLKILFNRDTLEILGVHCFGANASEIVHIGQAIMDQPGDGNTLKYFTDTTFNYPTMAEAYRVAALNGYNRLF